MLSSSGWVGIGVRTQDGNDDGGWACIVGEEECDVHI